jgi:TrmH family RNA methyltransferase
LTVVEEFVLDGEPPISGAVLHHLDATTLERVASTVSPQPHIAVVALPATVGLAGIGDGWILVADRVQDPGNLGTMIRSAVAAGAAAVVVTSGTVDPFSPKVVRASAGALFSVPCIEVMALRDVAGFELVGTSSHTKSGSVDYDRYDFTGRIALVMGNEAAGLEADAPTHAWVTIPHVGPVESLNVAMASTVLSFEIARQRKHRPPAGSEH